jgi:hypothetical protein
MMPAPSGTSGSSVGDPVVVGALFSDEALAAATSVIGRRALRVAGATDLVHSVDHDGACAVLFELGHPGFVQLCTRLAVIGSRLPLVLLLPRGAVPAADLLALSRIATFSLVYEHRELAAVLRRTMIHGVGSSDAQLVAGALDRHMPSEAAELALGLYVAGNRNVTVTETRARLGLTSALRNRLRALGLARASTIMGWACALGIVWRLEHDDCSLADAARGFGFETTRQCSDRVLYHTGRTPTALRERGFRALVAEFVEIAVTRASSAA